LQASISTTAKIGAAAVDRNKAAQRARSVRALLISSFNRVEHVLRQARTDAAAGAPVLPRVPLEEEAWSIIRPELPQWLTSVRMQLAVLALREHIAEAAALCTRYNAQLADSAAVTTHLDAILKVLPALRGQIISLDTSDGERAARAREVRWFMDSVGDEFHQTFSVVTTSIHNRAEQDLALLADKTFDHLWDQPIFIPEPDA
jgi:hypothetical protein